MSRTTYAALPHVGVTDIYPVGVLASLLVIRRALTLPEYPRDKRWPTVKREVRRTVHTLVRHVKARDWNALQNSFNGYLAEPYTFPGYMTRCGHGWTTERAIRDLLRHEEACRTNSEATA